MICIEYEFIPRVLFELVLLLKLFQSVRTVLLICLLGIYRGAISRHKRTADHAGRPSSLVHTGLKIYGTQGSQESYIIQKQQYLRMTTVVAKKDRRHAKREGSKAPKQKYWPARGTQFLNPTPD